MCAQFSPLTRVIPSNDGVKLPLWSHHSWTRRLVPLAKMRRRLGSSQGTRAFILCASYLHSPLRMILSAPMSTPAKANACSETLDGREALPPQPTCPKCHSEHVKAITMWRVAIIPHSITQPPLTMLACQEPSCRHKWSRPSEAKACAHTIQHLLDVSYGASSPMGRYACAECGTEIIRPYVDYHPTANPDPMSR